MRNPFVEKNSSESGKYQIKWYSYFLMVLKKNLISFTQEMTIKQDEFQATVCQVNLRSLMLKTFQTTRGGVSSFNSVKTHPHYIVLSQFRNSMFLMFFYQYFGLMLLLLLMELGVAIYLYIEKDKVSNEFKNIFLSTT